MISEPAEPPYSHPALKIRHLYAGGCSVLGLISAVQYADSMAHLARLRTTILPAVGAVLSFCLTASSAGAQDRNAVSTSRDSGIVRLPVIDRARHPVQAPLHCGGAVSDQGVLDGAGRSGLHLVWHAVRAKPVRWLQVQVVQARSRAPGQPERSLHSRRCSRTAPARFGSEAISSWTDSTQTPRHLLTIVSIPRIRKRRQLPSPT